MSEMTIDKAIEELTAIRKEQGRGDIPIRVLVDEQDQMFNVTSMQGDDEEVMIYTDPKEE